MHLLIRRFSRRWLMIGIALIVGFGLTMLAPATASAAGCSTLNQQNGASGPCVMQLQERLNQLGFTVGRFGSDGKYGPDTTAGVRAYQKYHGLTVDGKAGPKTRAHMASNPGPSAAMFKHLSFYKSQNGVNIIADKSDRKLYVFKNGKYQRSVVVRFGGRVYDKIAKKSVFKYTPTGAWTVQSLDIDAKSIRYGANMYYAVFFNGHIAIHQSDDFMRRGYGADGKDGSHGCVGVNPKDAKYIYSISKVGDTVVAVQN